MLILVVQVDEKLSAGTPALSPKFEAFLQEQLHIRTLQSKLSEDILVRLQQHSSGGVTVNAREKLDAVKLMTVERIRKGKTDGDATPSELFACRSIISSLL